MARRDVIVELDHRRIHSHDRNGRGFWVAADGLNEWWSSADASFEIVSSPGVDGAVDPAEQTIEPRSFLFRGFHRASSRDWADMRTRPWLSSLAKKRDLGFRVFSSGRWLSLRGARVIGRVQQREIGDTVTEFQMQVWSHDPRKYGADQTFTVDAVAAPRGGLRFPIVDGAMAFGESGAVSFPGGFQIHNPGSAEFYPTFRVAGPVDSFTVSSESLVLEYAAPVPAGQVLTLSPYAGGRAVLDGTDVSHNLTRAGWVPVGPEETRGYLFTPTNPGLDARLEVTYPEGAWW